MPAQGAQIADRGGAGGPRDRVVQIAVLCGVLTSGEPAGVVAGADEIIEYGRWPVRLTGMFDK